MTTFFDAVSVACFAVLVLTYFRFTTRDTRILVHLVLAGLVFAIANQVGNAGSAFLALALLLAGAAYAVLVVRS